MSTKNRDEDSGKIVTPDYQKYDGIVGHEPSALWQFLAALRGSDLFAAFLAWIAIDTDSEVVEVIATSALGLMGTILVLTQALGTRREQEPDGEEVSPQLGASTVGSDGSEESPRADDGKQQDRGD